MHAQAECSGSARHRASAACNWLLCFHEEITDWGYILACTPCLMLGVSCGQSQHCREPRTSFRCRSVFQFLGVSFLPKEPRLWWGLPRTANAAVAPCLGAGVPADPGGARLPVRLAPIVYSCGRAMEGSCVFHIFAYRTPPLSELERPSDTTAQRADPQAFQQGPGSGTEARGCRASRERVCRGFVLLCLVTLEHDWKTHRTCGLT